MIKSATETRLSSLINATSSENFKVPVYQREYSWTKKECQELFDDINDNARPYFLGSIILIEENNEIQIIDGQQRITSVSLLLMAIRNRFIAIDKNSFSFEIQWIEKMLSQNGVARLELQTQNNNKDDYEHLMKSNKIISGVTTVVPKNYGNRRIASNNKMFSDLVDPLNAGEIKELYDKVLDLSFVKITTDSAQSAYLLFDAMNNRGMDLTPFDLIKNKFIAFGGQIQKWEQLVECLGDNYADQEQFLRNNYNAFRAEYSGLNTPLAVGSISYKYGKATKSNLITIYDDLMSTDIDSFTKTLLERAKVYSLMLGNNSNPANNSDIEKVLCEFRRAGATSSFVLVLYLIWYQRDLFNNDDELLKVLQYVLRFSIRRNFTNIPSTGAVPGIMMEIIEEINQLPSRDFATVSNVIVDKLKAKSSDDTVLKSVLERDVYSDNRDMARYALCSLLDVTIGTMPKTKETPATLDLWRKDVKGKYVWTIEHIFPEGENIPQSWVDMIAGGDAQKAKIYQTQYVHKFGNLTLTGYNSELSNKPFDEKKNLTDKDGYYVGYNNGLSLNNDVISETDWTVQKIENRTKTIVSILLKKLGISSI